MKNKKQIPKERNLIAKDLYTNRLYKSKTIESKKVYNKKSRKNNKVLRDFYYQSSSSSAIDISLVKTISSFFVSSLPIFEKL